MLTNLPATPESWDWVLFKNVLTCTVWVSYDKSILSIKVNNQKIDWENLMCSPLWKKSLVTRIACWAPLLESLNILPLQKYFLTNKIIRPFFPQ